MLDQRPAYKRTAPTRQRKSILQDKPPPEIKSRLKIHRPKAQRHELHKKNPSSSLCNQRDSTQNEPKQSAFVPASFPLRLLNLPSSLRATKTRHTKEANEFCDLCYTP
ncbi:hypothetical protein M758_11G051000 [Ceratodon purpureus]|uniref:Uncharacterized protein n=1 Tax=Ceratodon purpureus TaxID=3225 RepID=A0A8T0GB94_CERPU|nr:hypothetical protein KC19_11G052500 [Ceratodon purpureus]KAG0600655.1 hypothetical protein M758_11G051000 [Ceratodon purpureus]